MKPEFPIIFYPGWPTDMKTKVEYFENDFTCKGCTESENCFCAWNLYNTDGDCLASK
jgi:hypothetical protein